jgi:hypothetical protein
MDFHRRLAVVVAGERNGTRSTLKLNLRRLT